MASALRLHGVSAGYGETVVIEDIELNLAPGECISIIGRNGVGKTTLLATVMGHTTLHQGEIALAGASLNRVPIYRRAARRLDARPDLRAVSEPQGAARKSRQPAFRRRAADAVDRPRADDQSVG